MLRIALVACAALMLGAIPAGCKLPAETDDGGDGNGGDGAAAADGRDAIVADANVDVAATVDAGFSCTPNDVTQTASPVFQFGVPGDPPAFTGGTIADGRYHLTESTVYTGLTGIAGPTGVTLVDTLVISHAATGTVLAHEVATGAGVEVRSTFTMQSLGTTLDVRPGCPRPGSGGASIFPYSATPFVFVVQTASALNTFERL